MQEVVLAGCVNGRLTSNNFDLIVYRNTFYSFQVSSCYSLEMGVGYGM
jgi:hypothetical protein